MRSVGLVGRKCGMTRIFTADGVSVPITVIMIEPNLVTQIKSVKTDSYSAIQVTTGEGNIRKITKPLSGHYAKSKVMPGKGLWEFRVSEEELSKFNLGDKIKLSMFKAGDKVDVTGVSKGCGFAGAHKRHHFSLQYATHGNSLSHRAPGSIGQNQTPGRVMPGKKMPGQMGNKKVTIQSLEIVEVDEVNNVILIQGSVPGSINGIVIIKFAIKYLEH